MKIRTVSANNRKRVFEVSAGRKTLTFPFAKATPRPTASNPVTDVVVDAELGNQAFSFVLADSREGRVHIEQVLEYNQDPDHLRDVVLYNLTLEAQRRLAASPLSKREVIRRLKTSPSQLYRLLDQTNYRKSLDQMLRLLHVLDCDVRIVVRRKTA